MQRIATFNRELNKFGAGKDGFSAGNPSTGTLATLVSNVWCDAVQEELLSLIEASGLAPSAALNQAVQSMSRLYGGGLTSVNATGALTADMAGLVLADASAGNVVLTLPATDVANGRPLLYRFVRTDNTANSVTIQRAGLNTFVGGATSAALVGRGAALTVQGNGGAAALGLWSVVGQAGVDSTTVGAIVFFAGATAAPTGYVKANGALLSRTSFAALFDYANAQGLVSEATWTANSWGRFSVGDGSTTFRVPDLRGEFLRGWDDGRGADAGRAVGSWQKGSLALGDNNTDAVWSPTTSSASLTLAQTQALVGLDAYNTADYTGVLMAFANLSSSQALPGTALGNGHSGTTRPRNVAALACIKF